MRHRTCSVEGCDRDLDAERLVAYGMCGMHYRRWKRHGDPNYVRPKIQGVAQCSIEGCEKVVTARGWCSKHYTRWVRYGSPTHRLRGEVVDGKRVCPRCDRDLPIERFEKYKAWCEPCALEYHSTNRPDWVSRKTVPTDCAECGTCFLADSRRSVCCSSACSAKRKARYDRAMSAARDRDIANAANRRWYANNRNISYRSKAAYRARRVGAEVEVVDRRAVFDRDGWICGICSGTVDRESRHPDPMSASLDHIIPLSRGGEHSYRNTQTAHLGCNVAKGARLTG